MSAQELHITLRILESENRLLERADQKSISLLSILGVFMVFFVVYYRIIPINPFTVTLICLYFAFALLAIVSLIMAIRPRISGDRYRAESETSAILPDPAFFSGICRFSNVEAYKAALGEALKDDSSIMNMYIRQLFSIAQINNRKYKNVQRGIFMVIAALVIELAIIVYLFIFYMGERVMPPIA